MKYLLDTNIVIAATLGIGSKLRRRIAACEEGSLVTSTIVYGEIMFGSVRGKPPPIDRVQIFLEEVPMIDFDADAAISYASLPFKRARFDRLIAAQALSRGLTVVTTNVSDFSDIAGLTIEDWTR